MPGVHRGNQQFQSTLPRGSDVIAFSQVNPHACFNPRSRVGATKDISFCTISGKFQSTLPRGSDSLNSREGAAEQLFQSTLPRGSDPLCP